ncbi:3617_t:CDS:2, partial [Gigaspora rosea]
ISDENEEDSEETIVYFTSNLAVNANNMYYSTVLVEYPLTKLTQEQELTQEELQTKKKIHETLKQKPCSKTSSNGSCAGLPVLRKIKENIFMQYKNNSSQNNNRASQILQYNEGYFIGCSLWSNGDSWHRFIPIPESSFPYPDEHNQPYEAQLENMS